MSADLRALLKGGAFLVVALVAGWAIGTALGASPGEPEATATPLSVSPVESSPRPLPTADAAGRDLDRLPRYPGSVRTAYRETTDEHFRLVATEYLADATIEEVRGFYQLVIGRYGWERADIAYDDGEWIYILVDGRIEALIELEMSDGLVEIDLQVSMPESTPTPEPTPEPTARPSPPPSPAPPPPPPPPGGGDDDDDDGDDDDGDDDGDGDDTDD